MCVCYFTWSLAYIPWSSSLSSFNFFMASLCYIVNASEYICKMKIGVWLFPSFSALMKLVFTSLEKTQLVNFAITGKFPPGLFFLSPMHPFCLLNDNLVVNTFCLFFISLASIILFWSQFPFLWSCWIFLNINIFLIFLFLESCSSSLIFLFSIS